MNYEQRLNKKVASLQSSLASRGLKLSRDVIRTRVVAAVDVGCMYCDKPLKLSDVSADHSTPLARGGSNTINNVDMIHKSCNRAKGVMDRREFLALILFLRAQQPVVYKDVMRRLKNGGNMFSGYNKKA